MKTFYVVIEAPTLNIVSTGTLDECTEIAKHMSLKNTGVEYTYCKVVPVGTHCHNRKLSF